MKALLIVASMIFVAHARAVELPHEPFQTQVALGKVASGTSLKLDFQLSLPKTQALNKGAPSFVAVYERQPGAKDWEEVQRFSLNDVFAMGQYLQLSKQVTLRSAASEVAVHSTVFHCGKDHKTACYIQGFQGIASRKAVAAGAPVIPFHIHGTVD